MFQGIMASLLSNAMKCWRERAFTIPATYKVLFQIRNKIHFLKNICRPVHYSRCPTRDRAFPPKARYFSILIRRMLGRT